MTGSDWFVLAATFISPLAWYLIGRSQGYEKGYIAGAQDKRRQIVDGMDNLLFAGVIKAYIRRDAVQGTEGPEDWIKVDGISVTAASETKH